MVGKFSLFSCHQRSASSLRRTGKCGLWSNNDHIIRISVAKSEQCNSNLCSVYEHVLTKGTAHAAYVKFSDVASASLTHELHSTWSLHFRRNCHCRHWPRIWTNYSIICPYARPMATIRLTCDAMVFMVVSRLLIVLASGRCRTVSDQLVFGHEQHSAP